MSETIILTVAAIIAVGVIAIIVLLLRPRPAPVDHAAEQRLAELNTRLDAMGSWLQNSHAQLQHTVNNGIRHVFDSFGITIK